MIAMVSFFFWPLLIVWLAGVAYSVFSFIAAIISLLSPGGMANFDWGGFIIMTIVSFVIDLVGAAFTVTYFVLLVWAWNSIRLVIFPEQNIAKKAFIADNYAEVKKVTTSGPIGRVYGFFEGAVNRFLSLIRSNLDQFGAGLYPKGALVLRTPAANWPILPDLWKARMGAGYTFDILAGNVDGRQVLVYSLNGAAYAVGIFSKDGMEAVLEKIRETGGTVKPLVSP